MAKQAMAEMDSLEAEMEADLVDRTGDPPYITKGVDPVLPVRIWRIKQAKVGEKTIRATSIEDAIRIFNGGKTMYPRSLLTVDELDRSGAIIKTDAAMREEADTVKQKYRADIMKRYPANQLQPV